VAGPITILLPLATGSGREIDVKQTNANAGGNTCTITRAGADNIDGAIAVVMSAQFASVKIVDSSSGTWVRTHVNQLTGDVTGASTANTVNVARVVNCPDTSVTPNVITCLTASGFPAAYVEGQFVLVEMNTTNTGATTINIAGRGAVAVTTQAIAALPANALVNGGTYLLSYDGTQFQLLTPDSTLFVPYTGATQTVNLGSQNLTTTGTISGLGAISGLTAGTVPKAATATTLANSTLLDNGTVVSTTEPLLSGVAATGTVGAYAVAVQEESNGAVRADRIGAPTQYIEVFGGGAAVNPGLHAFGAAKGLLIVSESSSSLGTNPIMIQQGVTGSVTTVGQTDATGNLLWSFALNGKTFATQANCSSSASPAVCTSAAAGSVALAVAATTEVVNTTAVTANSQIFVMYDSSLGAKLGVTCNTTEPGLYGITARTAATSFTITVGVAPITNPICFSYFIVN
jgi:hypothetical protein